MDSVLRNASRHTIEHTESTLPDTAGSQLNKVTQQIQSKGTIVGSKNFFENMTLQIPLTAKDVADFYSLPEFDREILVDEVRNFIELKMQALRMIAPFPKNGCCRFDDDGGILPPSQPVQKHRAQLRSSYTPPNTPGIRRI